MTSTCEQSRAFRAKRKLSDSKYFTRVSQKWRVKHPVEYLLRKAKNNAQRLGLEFNLTKEDITIPATCPVLGLPLETFQEGNPGWNNAPSVDRLDSSLGYIKGNVQVVSWRANQLKSNGTLEEFRRLVQWLEINGKKL